MCKSSQYFKNNKKLTFQLANIIHTIALVLPTVIINMLDSGIAHFINDERVTLIL